MGIAFPGESPEYRAARDRLLEQEIELRRAMEALAAARRQLPPGGVVPRDYAFQGRGADGGPAEVRLSELFAPGKDSLLIYSFMFPRDPHDQTPGPSTGQTALLPLAEGPCPTCAAFIDQLKGAAEHVNQHINLVVVAKTPLPRLLAFVEERGWRRLRFLSSANNTYNVDYHAETPEGAQRPMLSVFHRDADAIRHFWSSELLYTPTEPGEDPRHVGTLEPLWNMFDLTPRADPRTGWSNSNTAERSSAAQPPLARGTGIADASLSCPERAHRRTWQMATRARQFGESRASSRASSRAKRGGHLAHARCGARSWESRGDRSRATMRPKDLHGQRYP